MRRILWFVTLALAVAARAAGAGGVNLAWGPGCYPDHPVNLRTFACDTNAGSEQMLASFAPGHDVSDFIGVEAIVDLCAGGIPLPAWWQLFNAGSCRATSLTASADFTAQPVGACVDAWQGGAAGGVYAYQLGFDGGWDDARIKVAFALPQPVAIEAGTEYAGFFVRLDHAHTVGDGACGGCTAPICMVLNQVRVAGTSSGYEDLTYPLQNDHLMWQSAIAGCPFIVATRRSSWGMVKRRYR